MTEDRKLAERIALLIDKRLHDAGEFSPRTKIIADILEEALVQGTNPGGGQLPYV